MRRTVVALLALSAVMCAVRAAEPPASKAVEIAKRMMQAMGGEAAWQQAHFVRFDFIVKIRGEESITRSHLWDKRTGRYRLEDKAGNGDPGVVLFNVTNHQGVAYVSGRKLEGSAAAAALQGSYRTYSTDIEWLALPWMWLDPNVSLKYVGQKTIGGQLFDLVEVTVQRAAGAAGRYNAYVSTKSHLLEKCEVLGAPAKSLWDWQYVTTGGVKLASDHTDNEQNASISMGRVEVLDKVDDAYFADAAHWLAKLK